MTNQSFTWLRNRMIATTIICAALGVTAPALQAQKAAPELSAAEIRETVIGRTYDVTFEGSRGNQVDAVITIGADGRWYGKNRFTPARQDGTATNAFDGKHRMRGSRLCQTHWVVARNGQSQSRGRSSDERCYRVFSYDDRFVFYSLSSGQQTLWTPRDR